MSFPPLQLDLSNPNIILVVISQSISIAMFILSILIVSGSVVYNCCGFQIRFVKDFQATTALSGNESKIKRGRGSFENEGSASRWVPKFSRLHNNSNRYGFRQAIRFLIILCFIIRIVYCVLCLMNPHFWFSLRVTSDGNNQNDAIFPSKVEQNNFLLFDSDGKGKYQYGDDPYDIALLRRNELNFDIEMLKNVEKQSKLRRIQFDYYNIDDNLYEPLNRILPDFINLLYYFTTTIIMAVYFYSMYKKLRSIGNITDKLSIQYYCKALAFLILFFGFLCAILASCQMIIYAYQKSYYVRNYEIYKWIVLCLYFPLIYFFTAIIFTYFALKRYVLLRSMHMRLNTKQQQLKKLGLITCFMCVVGFAKSIADVIINIGDLRETITYSRMNESGDVNIQPLYFGQTGFLELPFYLVYEIIPCLLLNYVLQKLLRIPSPSVIQSVLGDMASSSDTRNSMILVDPSDKVIGHDQILGKPVYRDGAIGSDLSEDDEDQSHMRFEDHMRHHNKYDEDYQIDDENDDENDDFPGGVYREQNTLID